MSFNAFEALSRTIRDDVLIAYIVCHHEGRAFCWWPRQEGDIPPAHHIA